MERDTEIRLIRRVLGHVEAGTKDMASATTPGPVTEYFDAKRYSREMDTLFRDLPLIVGHASKVAKPGDFFTHGETGVPILVTRDKGGRLGAFINICRHRGATVCRAVSGHGARNFACPYHAWVYGIDGRLTDIPDAIGFADVDRNAMGLTPLPVAKKYGFIWVRPRPGAALDIDGFIGPLGPELEALGLASHTVFDPASGPAPTVVRRRMNWKLMVDTFLEGYHFKYAHSKSVYPLFLNNMAVFDRFEPHIRWVMPKRTMLDLQGTAQENWRLRDHCFLMYYVFPNTMIVAVGDHIATFVHFPTGPDDADMLLSVYVPQAPDSDQARKYWEKNHAMLLDAIDEDFVIGEGMQRGYRSGAQENLTYGRYEQAIGYFHQSVNRVLDARNDKEITL
jgi:phenylpropionate dioxygenase-like ring-hydroxylating dioxygenase large terminal subunit